MFVQASNAPKDLPLSQSSVLRIIQSKRQDLSRTLLDVLSVNIDLIPKCDYQFTNAVLEESIMILRSLFFLFSSSPVFC